MEEEPIQHHFETAEQQRDAAALGMWIFLGTEVLFFGALFMAYTFLRWSNPAAVAAGSRHLELLLGSINTAVLLTSSFVMTVGLYFHNMGRRRLASWMLIATAIMGMLFLGIKATEYSHVIHEGYLPGAHFRPGEEHLEGNPMPGGLVGALGTRGTPAQTEIPGSTEWTMPAWSGFARRRDFLPNCFDLGIPSWPTQVSPRASISWTSRPIMWPRPWG